MLVKQFAKPFFAIFFLLNTLFFGATVSWADGALLRQREAQVFIQQMVKRHGFSRTQLSDILREAQFQPQIIESMERPYEKKSWDIYKQLFLTQERLVAGIQFWKNNQKTLAQVEQAFGVPADIIVAIIGVETLYGKHQGNYRVLDALTTLAFYYPKRSVFFKKELESYLLLCRDHVVPANVYRGSYAGAMGKPQFMPSSYRFYALNITGKGKPDLMNNDNDVIQSVANYFKKHGWQRNEVVADPAEIQGEAYKRLTLNSKTPVYQLKQLLAAGVKPENELPTLSMKAGVIELDTISAKEYWVAYPNFYVITRYNTSPQYALAVHLLAQQLRKQWVLASKSPQRTA